MANLVGESSTGSYTGTSGTYTSAEWAFRAFTATDTGTATSLYVYFYDAWTANAVKLALWSSSGTLLAATSAITSLGSPGWISGAISDTSITSAQTYYLGLRPDTGYIKMYQNAVQWGGGVDINSTYASPGNLSDTVTDDLSAFQFAIYADGSTGGGSIVPQAMAQYINQVIS
jgi:hypothetical protein